MSALSPPPFLGRAAIAGVGYTPFVRESGRSVLSQAVEAARAALDDAALPLRELDGIATFMWQGDSVPSQAVATALGLRQVHYLLDLQMGGQAPCNLVMQAAMAVHSGLASNVLVFRALNGRSGSRVGTVRTPGAAANQRYSQGLSSYAQLIALWARRYMIETGATYEDLAAVPLAQRRHAMLNERAVVRTPLTLQDYFESPMIADPFRVADCTSEVDGACAVLVTSTTRARSLRHPPAVIASAAYMSGPQPGWDAGDFLLWDDCSRNYTSYLAPRLWQWAGIDPHDVDMAQLYDCFSSSVLFATEGLGLAERGGAADLIRSGTLPMNTNGGLLSEGYVHGMNTVAEAALQIQGRGGDRQVPNASTCVVTSGAMMDGSAMVLVRA